MQRDLFVSASTAKRSEISKKMNRRTFSWLFRTCLQLAFANKSHTYKWIVRCAFENPINAISTNYKWFDVERRVYYKPFIQRLGGSCFKYMIPIHSHAEWFISSRKERNATETFDLVVGAPHESNTGSEKLINHCDRHCLLRLRNEESRLCLILFIQSCRKVTAFPLKSTQNHGKSNWIGIQ